MMERFILWLISRIAKEEFSSVEDFISIAECEKRIEDTRLEERERLASRIKELEAYHFDVRDLLVDMSGYNPIDRHRDFMTVFGKEAGKRVLTQIAQWGRISKPVFHSDVALMTLREGERNMVLRIMAALTYPAEQKIEQRRKR